MSKEYVMQLESTIENLRRDNALLKDIKNEQEKALKIIAEKGLPLAEIDMIKQSANYNEYNIKFSWANFKNISIQKTEDEFELLKRYCDEQDN